MEVAVRFTNISKKFKFRSDKNSSVLDTIINVVTRDKSADEEDHDLWALRNLTFDINPGECVGLVGNNGSGKSTLLKVASGIIRPSTGRVEIRGRLSALLELGAGFHPDLSGRENIWLNASILGLSNSEITKIFDDVVEFSELGEFIEMPVKHYSSGMYMRLGFSVAVHVMPDVLLIDEILAVGDQSFQQKCIARLHKLNRQGVTVIFVSHTLETVRSLCSRIFWITAGSIIADGETTEVVDRYLASHDPASRTRSNDSSTTVTRWGSGEVKITHIRLLNNKGVEQSQFQEGEPLNVEMDYESNEVVKRAEFGLSFIRNDSINIGSLGKQVTETVATAVEELGTVRCYIPELPLLPGVYDVIATIYDGSGEGVYDHFESKKIFEVLPMGSGEESSHRISARWESAVNTSIAQDIDG